MARGAVAAANRLSTDFPSLWWPRGAVPSPCSVSTVRLSRDLAEQGYTYPELARMTRHAELVRVRRGAYVAASEQAIDPRVAHLQLLEATAAQSSSDFVVSHASAAVLHGLPVGNDQLDRVHLTPAPAWAGSDSTLRASSRRGTRCGRRHRGQRLSGDRPLANCARPVLRSATAARRAHRRRSATNRHDDRRAGAALARVAPPPWHRPGSAYGNPA